MVLLFNLVVAYAQKWPILHVDIVILRSAVFDELASVLMVTFLFTSTCFSYFLSPNCSFWTVGGWLSLFCPYSDESSKWLLSPFVLKIWGFLCKSNKDSYWHIRDFRIFLSTCFKWKFISFPHSITSSCINVKNFRKVSPILWVSSRNH